MPTARRPSRRAELVDQLLQATRSWSTATVLFHGALAAGLGLHATDHKAVDLLLQAGPLSAGALAERMGLTTSAVTTVIDRLERAGLVRRTKDARDRRRVVVQPVVTPAVEARFDRLMAPVTRDYARVLESFTADELEVIRRFVETTRALTEAHTTRLRALAERQAATPAAGAGAAASPRSTR